MNYKIKTLIDGSRFTIGNIMPSKFADNPNLRVGLRCTAELKKLVADAAEGGWINADAYAEDGKKPEYQPKPSTYSPPPLEDEVPF